jgi:hypothetical protein
VKYALQCLCQWLIVIVYLNFYRNSKSSEGQKAFAIQLSFIIFCKIQIKFHSQCKIVGVVLIHMLQNSTLLIILPRTQRGVRVFLCLYPGLEPSYVDTVDSLKHEIILRHSNWGNSHVWSMKD